MQEIPRAARLTRRQWLRRAAGASALLWPAWSLAAPLTPLAAVERVLAGRVPEAGELELTAPAIAENGNTVPIAVAAGGPFTPDFQVTAIHVFAPENPLPEVISFHFSPRSGRARVATRIRLAKTQDVIAIAELADGRVWQVAREVKVTIGGCGG